MEKKELKLTELRHEIISLKADAKELKKESVSLKVELTELKKFHDKKMKDLKFIQDGFAELKEVLSETKAVLATLKIKYEKALYDIKEKKGNPFSSPEFMNEFPERMDAMLGSVIKEIEDNADELEGAKGLMYVKVIQHLQRELLRVGSLSMDEFRRLGVPSEAFLKKEMAFLGIWG